MWKMSNDMGTTASVAHVALAFAKFQWSALTSYHHLFAMGFGYKVNSINTGLFSITKES